MYLKIIISLLSLDSISQGAQCRENSIQLIGDLSGNEGFVAICLGGSWGKVCGESLLYFSSSIDNLNHVGIVICRQLGLSIEGEHL